jgi:hypothetical protein
MKQQPPSRNTSDRHVDVLAGLVESTSELQDILFDWDALHIFDVVGGEPSWTGTDRQVLVECHRRVAEIGLCAARGIDSSAVPRRPWSSRVLEGATQAGTPNATARGDW